jgi:hypothetical protein
MNDEKHDIYPWTPRGTLVGRTERYSYMSCDVDVFFPFVVFTTSRSSSSSLSSL